MPLALDDRPASPCLDARPPINSPDFLTPLGLEPDQAWFLLEEYQNLPWHY